MRLSDPARDRLAALAAVAARYSRSSAIAVDARQGLDAIADQRRAAHGRGNPAVLDQIALRDAEYEVAGGGLDLAAAELTA